MNTLGRRAFLASGMAAVGVAMAGAPAAARRSSRLRRARRRLPFAELPNFCAHEHWGSFDAIGSASEGFRADVEPGATPRRRVGVLDLVLDPYFNGWLHGGGARVQEMLKAAGIEDLHAVWQESPERVLRLLRPHLEHQLLTGVFQCTRRGILQLHGADLQTLAVEDWLEADAALGAAYDDIFRWYEDGMGAMGFEGLIRPMQPEFYFQDFEPAPARQEMRFTDTVMRIDPFLHLWRAESPRREALVEKVGVDPKDAESWRAFLHAIFEQAAAKRALGIKQLQAYSRPLDYPAGDDAAVLFRGDLTPEQVRAFQDWVVNVCCAEANARGWQHQVHVGTHNLDDSTPLPLEGLAKRYPEMPIVMIHCWPFLEEAGWLAKQVPNIYIDTCWQPILNPALFRRSLRTWFGYVPTHKLLLSHDATSLEMAAGSALFTREILEEELDAQRKKTGLDAEAAEQMARAMLHDNAAALAQRAT